MLMYKKNYFKIKADAEVIIFLDGKPIKDHRIALISEGWGLLKLKGFYFGMT